MLAQSHFFWLTKNQCMLSAKHACSEPFLLAYKELMHVFCKHACSEPFLLAFEELMHAFCQAYLPRAISSSIQGANAYFLPSMLAQSQFFLAYEKRMHAFSQSCLPRAISSYLQGAHVCLMPSMFAQNHFLFPTWNLDILCTKDAFSGVTPRQRRTKACALANILVQGHFPLFKKSWFYCIMQAFRCNFQWWTIRSSLTTLQ